MLLAACRSTTPTPAPSPPSPSTPPATTPRPSATAQVAPYPAPAETATARASPTPVATVVRRVRVFFPFLGNEKPPPTVTPPPPTATPVPATPKPTPKINPFETPGLPPPTATPRPTPPPAPTPGPLAPITKVTKWGLGVYRESNEIFRDLVLAKPGVLLLMEPTPGWAQRVRKEFPRAFIVGRRRGTEGPQPLDDPSSRGAAFADFVAELGLALKGVVDAWISYNEVLSHNNYEDYRRYNAFQVAFARRLQDTYGLPAVAGNDGSGAVEPPDYPKYFAEAIRASRYFGVHAYSPPGTSSMRVDAEWHALRYRKVHDELERAGIGDVQMVMTESGLGDGWVGRLDADQMAQEFFWFTDELQKDPYVIGHAAFGLFGNDPLWRNFDMRGSEVVARMGYYEPPPRRA